MKLNLGSGRFPLPGFTNLDLDNGWDARDGLPFIRDNTVEAVTISHLLMYLTWEQIGVLLQDVYRVLEPGGVVRVTEDEAKDEASSRLGGQPNAVTVIGAADVVAVLLAVGFLARRVPPDETAWRDDSLIQHWHGDEPDVFHVEGHKPSDR